MEINLPIKYKTALIFFEKLGLDFSEIVADAIEEKLQDVAIEGQMNLEFGGVLDLDLLKAAQEAINETEGDKNA